VSDGRDQVQFDRDPVREEESFADLQQTRWRESLTTEDRTLFDAGRRLSDETRAALLSKLSQEEREERGLLYASDEEPSHRPRVEEARRRRRQVKAKQILMDLWDLADVLWLDLAADVFKKGMNMGYGKEMTPFKQYPNAPMSDELAQEYASGARDDIREGRAVGFFDNPPFPVGFGIPALLVKKSDGGFRICKNYSKPDVNERTGAVVIHPQPFDQAVNAFVAADKNGWMVEWDVEGAYTTLTIQNKDHPLTVFM
jgi:hypothetical protein